MSVTLTDIGFYTKPILKSIPEMHDMKEKNQVLFNFSWSAQGAGDVSGGNVEADINFGTLDSKLYYVITDIDVYTDIGSAIAFYILTQTNRWDNTYYPGHADELNSIYATTLLAMGGIPHAEQLKHKMYLGRPRSADSEAGILACFFATNTNAKLYNITIKGYALRLPLIKSCMMQ